VHVLGIETSCSVCSVGLVDDEALIVEQNIVDPHVHSEKLLTLVEEVLERGDVGLGDLDAIAVSIGPGSFTGLRIGLSTAKGLCFSLERKLIEIPTFDAVAHVARDSTRTADRIVIVVDAKQGEFYCGSIEMKRMGDATSMTVHTCRADDIPWKEYSDQSTVWITDSPEIIRTHGVPPQLTCEYSSFCRGDAVAHLARAKYGRNEFADLALIEPRYLKDFIVKTSVT